ncbi:gtp-binding protein 2 [Acrodontium crateriforme]|uniref:Gtp-binding protein 2 n=1 Tax=Acrodontium crateriforme TaxID=150365 RepID=A0AAQ3R1V8_9PEZI|nr:gtp-binding protein 2 [Acrodontium crateriforme]
MASIFTYEPDPPRVASPWLQTPDGKDNRKETIIDGRKLSPTLKDAELTSLNDDCIDQKVTRLQAEPQEGPVEYKLHLLLRPRRKFKSTSTGNKISGSNHANFGIGPGAAYRHLSESAMQSASGSGSSTPTSSLTQQTRQHRLQQLTTQLLWRLQQSSPHHSSSATNMILPSLPEALPELQAPQQPAKLLHGLEESQGALYEIGVSDDGTLVGLAEDELNESLNNLRAMAACLGCTVEVLRKETVGECEWVDDTINGGKERQIRRTGKLVVAEALVKPCFEPQSPYIPAKETESVSQSLDTIKLAESGGAGTEQLRITLTGPTMSGKSTLLGTLTTNTLDNGRGKSRLSMLKHRHEINSGVTSSVTQEIMGFQDTEGGNVEPINYATENVASWIDVHVAATGSRLVLISDSAGHPRYRRTTMRGLVGWAPHWTLLCVSADDSDDSTANSGASHHVLGPVVAEMDLSGAQMDLCLRLGLPLAIVITKLDLASRTGLKVTLSKVLDALKAAGRKPAIIPNAAGPVTEDDLKTISGSLIENAYKTSLPLLNDAVGTVPIVLTSAVQGTGITNLLALLHELPLPECSSKTEEPNNVIFHIEDIYNKPTEGAETVVSGRLRGGQVTVGSTLMLGPFATHESFEDSEDSDERPRRRRSSHIPTSRSFPGALPNLIPPILHLSNQEWRRVKVISIRNLRLPVHSLMAEQVGTMAIVPDTTSEETFGRVSLTRIRKGMVLIDIQPSAVRTLVAELKREDLDSLAVGNHVVVYSASVRASARVVSTRAPDSPVELRYESKRDSDEHNPFEFDDMAEALVEDEKDNGSLSSKVLVTLSFDSSKEFVVIGDQVLVMPGGGPGLYGGHERGEKGIAGLEGFVGKIVETHS